MNQGAAQSRANPVTGIASGAVIGTLGGLIGLGGAEFRLPLLIGLFRFVALEAVIINKATSLVVVGSALPFRLGTVPFGALVDHWTVILNLLSGSLIGAWVSAGWATRLQAATLYKVIAVLLLAIALILIVGHGGGEDAGRPPLLTGWLQVIAGVGAGFVIGSVAALMGVAGGELLIPTLVLLFGLDVKLAGSLSLAISLPTMIVGFTRYSRDSSFSVLNRNRSFVLLMALGSIVGTFIGGQLLQIVPSAVILPALAVILIVSAIKVWRHK
jgi:uncharacterized membrane protein YfcA